MFPSRTLAQTLTNHRLKSQRQGTSSSRPSPSLVHPSAAACRWGEFEIAIKIFFVQESGEKALTFYHHLKLHPWTLATGAEAEIPPPEVAAKLGPVHSWQYDEVVFSDPYQAFLAVLTAHPPTPLPKVRRRAVPFHTAHPDSLEASKGGVPEFQQEMEKEEAERLDRALKTVVEDTHSWRNRLIERENEANRLKKEIEALSS